MPDRLPGLLNQELAVSRFIAVLPEAHPLAALECVPLAELVKERFVDAREGFGTRVTLDRRLSELGLSRRVATEVSDLGEIPRFVAARLALRKHCSDCSPNGSAAPHAHPAERGGAWLGQANAEPAARSRTCRRRPGSKLREHNRAGRPGLRKWGRGPCVAQHCTWPFRKSSATMEG